MNRHGMGFQFCPESWSDIQYLKYSIYIKPYLPESFWLHAALGDGSVVTFVTLKNENLQAMDM